MAENAARSTQLPIDPMFFIPDGVDELVYDDADRSVESDIEQESVEETVDDLFLFDETDGGLPEGVPDTPDILEVVEQVLRTTSSGAQVVDLILEVEDIPGISKYEFKVAKV